VRVGVDQRSAAQRMGKPKLVPGIYALCEIESAAYPSTGANDEFWYGENRATGWPTVKVRYVRTYEKNPLTIDMLHAERPQVSRLLLKGFQAASFPIDAKDFQTVVELLEKDTTFAAQGADEPVSTAEKIAEMEKRYLNTSPEVKEKLSKRIERGPIGALVKEMNGFKCQLCHALGLSPIGFKKKNGELYVEAHHAMPVSKKEIGSLTASNVMTLCPNHHRQVHYGNVEVVIGAVEFTVSIDDKRVLIPRFHSTAPIGKLDKPSLATARSAHEHVP
jgi:hypothetical protein